ncbi:MAG: PilZ domain-containing protein [Bdellovibrionota bacterium]
MSATPKNASGGGAERRRAKRRPILHSFSVFVVVPKKGVHRLQVHDLSDLGMGFDVDMEGDATADYPIKQGDEIDVRFYLNQSLFIPLSVTVARLETKGDVRRIGAEFGDKKAPNYQAFLAFLTMLDSIADVVQLE